MPEIIVKLKFLGGNECSDGYGFYCDGGARCLSFSAVCSGYTSCLDGADEENCCKTISNSNIFNAYYCAHLLLYTNKQTCV